MCLHHSTLGRAGDPHGTAANALVNSLERRTQRLTGCAARRPQVAFPYLYNNRPRKVRLSAYHHPMVMYIKMEDPDLPAFYYDPLIHPIAFYKAAPDAAAGADALDDDEEDAFVLPEGA